jgi:hypothetical protein
VKGFLAALLIGIAGCAWAATEELVSIPARGGATLSYLLIQDKPGTAKAVAISFVGGSGAIDLVKRLSQSYPLISVSGGDPPQTGPCDPLAPHGYFGREASVVQAMKNWMLGREFAREIQ